ncbi:unnamed protein product [Darwinula stevensoni]|uniref:NADP-dependent oxidoreductase domain-containing protein n=1 Tax=Darwinula stevensoni TaxID=69355 RepID=A0A7R9A8B6_9CRUS|nr:unnamed protein product [Darwinula stevensoni]CAG0896226.1 unnamed protein product [Darwinula stevensoni]
MGRIVLQCAFWTWKGSLPDLGVRIRAGTGRAGEPASRGGLCGPAQDSATRAVAFAVDRGILVEGMEAEEGSKPPPSPVPSPSPHHRSRSLYSRQSTSATGTGMIPGLKFRNLGKSGLKVTNLGLATWTTLNPGVSEETAEAVITWAYEVGINYFDTSEVYSGGRAEALLGGIIRKKGWRRSSYVLSAKVHWGKTSPDGDMRGLSRKTIVESVKGSLDRLGVDYIDVVILHKADPMCPMEEVVRAMSYVISEGWAMYWGTARWSAVEIMEAYTNARTFNCPPPIVEQTEYHFFCREKTELQMSEMFNKIGVGCMTWSPLGAGLIATTGKTEDGCTLFARPSFRPGSKGGGLVGAGGSGLGDGGLSMRESRLTLEDLRLHEEKFQELLGMTERLGCSLAQLSLAWCLKNEHVQCVLVGAASVQQLAENILCLQVVPKLTGGVLAELERVLGNKPVKRPLMSTMQMQGVQR